MTSVRGCYEFARTQNSWLSWNDHFNQAWSSTSTPQHHSHDGNAFCKMIPKDRLSLNTNTSNDTSTWSSCQAKDSLWSHEGERSHHLELALVVLCWCTVCCFHPRYVDIPQYLVGCSDLTFDLLVIRLCIVFANGRSCIRSMMLIILSSLCLILQNIFLFLDSQVWESSQ